jgi:predicted ArsR family transcriptional regulator
MEDASKRGVRNQILHLLKMGGAQTATALAQQLGVSPMAIRQHLQILKAEQWVRYEEERRPAGRPVKLWQLTDHTASRFPDRHADLMVDVLHSVETLFGPEGIEQVITYRSQQQLQAYDSRLKEMGIPKDWRQQAIAIAQLRNQEGYMAEIIDQPGGDLLLVENHCPIQAAAQTCPAFCAAEREIFQALLGSAIMVKRVEHLLAGDRRCAYQIVPISS